MNLLAAERIKLFSTRSPWWSLVAAVALTVAFAAAVTASAPDGAPVNIALTQLGSEFGLAVILVMAALAVTTEYRFNTIKTTFQAIPGRTSALLAKTVVVAVTAGVVGLIAAFGSLGMGMLIQPDIDLALHNAADWRAVAGAGLVFAIGTVIAMAVGILVRQTAGAVALLLAYSLMVEELIVLIPGVGADIQRWMPFKLGERFLTGGPAADGMPGPWGSLAVFGGYAVVLFAVALVAAKKRDA
jgi:ABC-2 type transport system permease protein